MKLIGCLRDIKNSIKEIYLDIFGKQEYELICDYCETAINSKFLNYDKASGKIYHTRECSTLGLLKEIKEKRIISSDIVKIHKDLGFILLKKGILKQSEKLKQETKKGKNLESSVS